MTNNRLIFVSKLVAASVEKNAQPVGNEGFNSNRAKAITKFYLMDTDYVPTKERKHILAEINKLLKTNWSITSVRDAHPSNLAGIVLTAKGPIPEEVGYPGVALALNNLPNDATVYLSVDEGNILELKLGEVSFPAETPAIDKTPVEQPKPAAPKLKKVNQSNSQPEESNMSNNANAVTQNSTQDEILAHYKENKEAVKALAGDFVDAVSDKAKREKIIGKWLKSDKERKEAWESFCETLDDKLEKHDIRVALFIHLAKKGKKEINSLEKALEGKKDSDSSKAEKKDIAVSFGVGAVVGGGINMFLNGVTPGAIVGTAVAAGGCYLMGKKIDEGEATDFDQRPGALLVGGGIGYVAAGVGRLVEGHLVETFFSSEEGETTESVNVVINNTMAQPAEASQHSMVALGLY